MNIVIKDTKIIAYGIIDYELEKDWKLIKDYEKSWPLDEFGKRVIKNAFYWDNENKEVKAKTIEMIQTDITKIENIDIKSTCELLNKVLYDCETFDDLKTKISGMII